MTKKVWEHSAKRSPWLNAAYAMMADGEWRPYSDVYGVMWDLIPPGRAKNTTIERRQRAALRRGREAFTNHPSDEELIQSGRNQIITQTLHTVRDRIEIQRLGPDKSQWRIRLRTDLPYYPGNHSPKGFRLSSPKARDKQRKKSVETRRETRRLTVNQLTDYDAHWNNTMQQRAAVFTRPWLWPTNPVPASQTNPHRDMKAGFCTYTEEDGKEKWVITQTWPTQETFEYYDVFDLVEKGLWRARLSLE